MDPNATIDLILMLVRDGQTADAMQACGDLYEWVNRGGFFPTCPAATYVAIGDDGPIAYTLLTSPYGYVKFEKCDLQTGEWNNFCFSIRANQQS